MSPDNGIYWIDIDGITHSININYNESNRKENYLKIITAEIDDKFSRWSTESIDEVYHIKNLYENLEEILK